VDEGTLGIHQIKLVVKTSPSFSDGGGVAQHADSTLDLGQVATWNNSWWLVVDSDLETSWTPIDKLDGPLGFDGGDGSVDILRDNITTVQHAASHVLSMTRITLHHLVSWLKAGVCDFSNRQLLMVGLLSRDYWSISNQREMDTWVWHQVGLELSQVNVQSTIKAERGSDGTDNLTNEPVEVSVSWAFDVQITATDVVDGFIVNHEGTVGVLQGSMGGQDRVVWLNNCSGNLKNKTYAYYKKVHN
jgi:hypothetical protein